MAEDFVGTKRWIRQATPYEIYMDEQKLPIHRGTIGFYDIRDLTLAEYMKLLQHDVSAEYASSLYELGYSFCDLDDLVRLRDQGITASFIRKANKQAGDTLTVSELLRSRTRGEY